MIISVLSRRPVGETDPAAHMEAIRKYDWSALWRPKPGWITKAMKWMGL